MASVRQSGTGPELTVRKLLTKRGYRYRLNRRNLPGKPDLTFVSRRKVIFIHGCYWHGHGCAKGRLPKSRLDYWSHKIQANKARDHRVLAALAALGWKSLVIWQCELRDQKAVMKTLSRFLGRL